MALENGEICPIQYSVWEDMRYFRIHRKHKFGVLAVVLENKKYRKNKLKNILELNKNRMEIGIGTYDNYVRKIIFQESQDEFYFGINEGVIEL